MNIRFGAAVVFAALTFGAPGAFAANGLQKNGSKGGVVEAKTMHFIIHYAASVDETFIRKLTDKAEECYMSVTQDLHFFRDEPWTFDNRATIVVYADKDEYMQKTQMPSWSAGGADTYKKEIYTFDGSWGFFESVLVHELTHLIYKEYAGKRTDIPLWLEEGAAQYMEYKNRRTQLGNRVRQLLSGDFIPLSKVMTMTSSDIREPASGGDDFVTAYYLESFSLFDFLLQKYGTFQFSLMNRAMRGGSTFEKAFFDTYRSVKDWSDLERKWLASYGKE